jgi:hypothetical protein
MEISPDPKKPLGEAIKEMLNDRTSSCDYYYSWAYEENRRKHSELIDRIGKRIGKKLCKRIWKDYFDVESLEGEFHAALSESCYRLGFTDALILSRELDQVGEGHKTIFN